MPMVGSHDAGVEVVPGWAVWEPQHLPGAEYRPRWRRWWRRWGCEGHGSTPGLGSAPAGSQWLQVQSKLV